MNATLTIQVRVLGAQAMSQIGAIQKQVNTLNASGAGASSAAMASAGKGAGFFASKWQSAGAAVASTWSTIRAEWAKGTNVFQRTTKSLERVGQSLRRSGQQIMFGFTLPVALAGKAMMGWALDNQRAMTQVKKVYGDFSYSQQKIDEETNALSKTFELLSSRLGVAQSEVINIGAAWAGAGLAGRDLAEATQATLETMILGEMDAEKATQALISTMATWRTNTDRDASSVEGKFSELTDTLAVLNSVENQTGARFVDLVDILARAGGAARSAGIDMRELAALGASLVPATGSGGAAGNALKTMFSRLLSPTRETLEILQEIGIETNSTKWMGANVLGKIQQMGTAFGKLDQAQKNVVTSMVAGRWQLNRFEVMMADVVSGNGFYQKALDASADKQRRQGTYLKELNAVLDSNPKKLEIMANVLKNELSKTMIQFIPIIIGVLGVLARLAQAFNDLSPGVKTFIFGLITVVAVLGPVLMLLGVFTTTMKFAVEALGFFNGILKVSISILGFFVNAFFGMLPIIGIAQQAIVGFARNVAIAMFAPTGAVRVFASRVWVELSWAAQAFKVFAGKVWVSILLAGDAFVAWYAKLGVWFSGTTLATSGVGAAFTAMTSAIWASMASAATAVWSGVLSIGAALAAIPAAIATAIGAVAAALGVSVGAVVAAIVAIVALLIAGVVALFNKDFRDGVINAIKAIGRAIWGLPKIFASALSALLRVVAKVVTMIVDWLSYLNPFQRHSPSLVDNVRAGVATILDEYSNLRGVSAHIMSAVRAHLAFQQAIAGAQGGFDAQETAKQRSDVASAAPSALPAFDNMVAARETLRGDLIPLTVEIQKQSVVVAGLTAAYDQLEAKLKSEQRILDSLESKLGKVNDAISASEAAVDRYASAGITGMRAMEDEIFANTMAQRRLQLAIMDLEDAGSSIDDIRSRMEALNGEMEMLTGERQGLYLSGAGSDITSVYDDQIDLIREQQASLEDTASAVDDLTRQLQDLQRAGERLDLERSINFDPQLRQIDQLATGLNELPFDEIIAKIMQENTVLAGLRPQQQALNDQVARQRAVVEAINVQHDALKEKLDAEAETLSKLESAYSDIEQLISEMNSQMSDFATNAKSAADSLSGAAGGSLDGISGDYDISTGTGTLDTNSTLAEIEAFNAEQQKLLEDMFKDMPDPFQSLRDKWNGFKQWFQESLIGDFVGWIGRNFSLEGIKNAFNETWEFIKRNFSATGLKNIGRSILNGLKSIGGAILNVLLWPFRQLADLLRPIWEPVFAAIGKLFGVVVGIVTTAWNIISGVFVWAWQNVIYPVLMALWNFFYTYIFPVFQLLWGIVQIAFAIVVAVIKVAVKIVLGILGALWWVVTNVGNIFVWLWENVVKPVWNFIVSLLSWVWNVILKPIFNAIWGFIRDKLGPAFVWLWENVIKPAWDKIKDKIKEAWDKYIKPALDAIKKFIDEKLIPAWNSLKDTVGRVWDGIVSVVKSGAEKVANFVVDNVNIAIRAFNALANAVKGIGEKLGITITINTIPELKPVKLAKGGIPPVDADGGLYAGVRAIVGEGSKVWPEYVIPTDPRYRDRAKMLAEAAGRRVGLFAQGGTVGQGREDQSVWDRAKGAVGNVVGSGLDAVKNLMKDAARLIWDPVKAVANSLIDQIPSDFIKSFGRKPINMIDEWINNSDPKISGDPSSLDGWRGRVGSYLALIKYFESTGVPGVAGSTIRPGATTRGSGNTRASLHASARAVDFFTRPSSVDSDGLLAIYRAFLPVKNLLTELIYSGPGGSNPSNPITAADHHNHVHVGLARGGAVDAQRVYQFAKGGSFKIPHGNGGILAQIGEGRNDERVQITPIPNKGGEGKTVIEINGDLSFPNITNGDDAEKLIENLKALAS